MSCSRWAQGKRAKNANFRGGGWIDCVTRGTPRGERAFAAGLRPDGDLAASTTLMCHPEPAGEGSRPSLAPPAAHQHTAPRIPPLTLACRPELVEGPRPAPQRNDARATTRALSPERSHRHRDLSTALEMTPLGGRWSANRREPVAGNEILRLRSGRHGWLSGGEGSDWADGSLRERGWAEILRLRAQDDKESVGALKPTAAQTRRHPAARLGAAPAGTAGSRACSSLRRASPCG